MTKQATYNAYLDKCPGAPRCHCRKLKCYVDTCRAMVAGHGFMVCDWHHEGYVNSGAKVFLIVWASFQTDDGVTP